MAQAFNFLVRAIGYVHGQSWAYIYFFHSWTMPAFSWHFDWYSLVREMFLCWNQHEPSAFDFSHIVFIGLYVTYLTNVELSWMQNCWRIKSELVYRPVNSCGSIDVRLDRFVFGTNKLPSYGHIRVYPGVAQTGTFPLTLIARYCILPLKGLSD